VLTSGLLGHDLLVPAAHAQSTPRGFDRSYPDYLAQALTPRPALSRPSSTVERAAVDIYAGARKDMEAGRTHDAERRLEYLVARFPDTAIADVARRDLRQLYARNDATPPSSPAAPSQTTRNDGDLPTAYASSARITRSPLEVQVTDPHVRTTQGRPAPKPAQREPGAAMAREAALVEARDAFSAATGDRIFFADGSADIGSRGRAALDAQAAWLQDNPHVDITIEGHADDVGSAEINATLAQQRAAVVRQRFLELGVADARMRTIAMARSRALVSCSDPACAAQNRRALVVITGVRAPPERAAGGTPLPQRAVPR
jgi:peptidoglycan-associated lipoprotein